jgi:hypothetical protein
MTAHSSDAARVAGLLARTALCIDCIARQVAIPSERADELIREIASSLNLTEKTGRCNLCASVRLVYSIT